MTVVGNLIGDADRGRRCRAPPDACERVNVRLGDRVSRGQRLAKIEDFEIVEQVKQAEASHEVAQATIRQREADLQARRDQPRTLEATCSSASCSPSRRSTTPRRATRRRWRSSTSSKAQTTQSKARLDELRINLGNTVITSPVNGFVGKRNVDPGRLGRRSRRRSLSVVDITRVRLVANVVEKDLAAA